MELELCVEREVLMIFKAGTEMDTELLEETILYIVSGRNLLKLFTYLREISSLLSQFKSFIAFISSAFI